jgi:putative lipoprotein
MSLTTFSSAFRRLREKMDLIKTKRKALKMKNKMLIYILLFSLFSSISFAAVDCSDPKNRPRFIGGVMISAGKKECDVARGSAARAKEDLDLTIGRNPVTGKVTSRAELAGRDNATMRLENAQMNYGRKKLN